VASYAFAAPWPDAVVKRLDRSCSVGVAGDEQLQDLYDVVGSIDRRMEVSH
jgi:hypothetical protein